MPSILIVEDEENLRLTIAKRLRRSACRVDEAGSVGDARARLTAAAYDLIVTDVNLPDGNGVDLVEEVAQGESGADSVVITAYGTVENAVDAMRRGASDYLQKPVSLDELSMIVGRLLEARAVKARLAVFERSEAEMANGMAIVGADAAWLQAIDTAKRFAEAHSTTEEESPLASVLITGETGTGKGVVARLVHDHASAQLDGDAGPFVHVNCAAIPANLVESELFGHEKGAFTDARADRRGFFELADGGTLFLDEIGEMSPELQAKLLLVMENGTYRRVGGSVERRVSTRVVAATNQDLGVRVGDGGFRQDLYYRLGAFVIALPALRDRGEDAALLAQSTLDRLVRERARDGLCFSDEALAAIRAHSWPGNARELVNAVQRAVILCRGQEIASADLALVTPRDPAGAGSRTVTATGEGFTFDFDHGPHTIEAVERALLEQALERCKGNITQAARLVGMPRGSFRYRMEKAGLRGQ